MAKVTVNSTTVRKLVARSRIRKLMTQMRVAIQWLALTAKVGRRGRIHAYTAINPLSKPCAAGPVSLLPRQTSNWDCLVVAANCSSLSVVLVEPQFEEMVELKSFSSLFCICTPFSSRSTFMLVSTTFDCSLWFSSAVRVGEISSFGDTQPQVAITPSFISHVEWNVESERQKSVY